MIMKDIVTAEERLPFPPSNKWWEKIIWEVLAIISIYFLLFQLTTSLGDI